MLSRIKQRAERASRFQPVQRKSALVPIIVAQTILMVGSQRLGPQLKRFFASSAAVGVSLVCAEHGSTPVPEGARPEAH